MTWQPIETAPKGQPLILYFPADPRHGLGPMIYVAPNPPGFPRKPTHWMPLQEPPK